MQKRYETGSETVSVCEREDSKQVNDGTSAKKEVGQKKKRRREAAKQQNREWMNSTKKGQQHTK